MGIFCGLCLVLFGSDGDHTALSRYESSEIHMGSRFRVVCYAAEPEQVRTVTELAFSRIAELDAMLSDYQSDSELNRLSRTAPSDRFVPISSELGDVLRTSQWVSCRSGGAFDVTVGPLTKLWRRARRKKQLPSRARLAQALEAVDFHAVRLDAGSKNARLLRRGMRLDLGGIAKGFAVDEALRCLRANGIQRALVDGGGDIAVGEPPPGRLGWSIAISELDPDEVPQRFLLLRNQAVATSGDARQYVEIDGQRYSHIVDPRTGLGLQHRSRVTVVGASGMLADSMASAVSVLGPQAGVALGNQMPGMETQVATIRLEKLVHRESQGFCRLVDTSKRSVGGQ